jgi:hypothetical protein
VVAPATEVGRRGLVAEAVGFPSGWKDSRRGVGRS